MEKGLLRVINAKLRDECLNGEIFYSLKEATVVIEQWRKHFNTVEPHSSLGYRPHIGADIAVSGLQHGNAIISVPLVRNISQVSRTGQLYADGLVA